MRGHFDQRTLAVLASESGAVALIIIGLISPSFIRPGAEWGLAVAGVYTLVSIVITVRAGKLSNAAFTLLSFGGMFGIAASAVLITDNGSAHAVLVLLAAIPALAAMGSPRRVVIVFISTAAVLAGAVVSLRADSITALTVGGVAVLMAISVPAYLVSALRKALSELLAQQSALSKTDPLTQALNRRGLLAGAETVFRRALTSNRQVGFLVADLDYFKRVNDELGHIAGDAVLVAITRLLHAEAPPESLIARSGGEEFLVLTVVNDRTELVAIADRIRTTVVAQTEVTLSLGGVCAPLRESGSSPASSTPQAILDALFSQADQCLYNAKQLGRNRVETSGLATLRWNPPGAHQVPRRQLARPYRDESATELPMGTQRAAAGATLVNGTVARLLLATLRSYAGDRHGDPVTDGAGTVAPLDSDVSIAQRPITTTPRPYPYTAPGGTMIEILHPDHDRTEIDRLLDAGGHDFVDMWGEAGAELTVLDQLIDIDPNAPRHKSLDINDADSVEQCSRYVVFPWRGTVVRMPDAHLYYRLKTARNRYLVTAEEQHMWSKATVAVAGLSVGSSALIACSLSGARRFQIADPDEMAPTNLNRMIGSVCDIGRSKIELACRRILEQDPYSSIKQFPLGYGPGIADDFLAADGAPVSLVIEEIDDVAMKIDLRRHARALGIPVISATDIGDNLVLDIERYDIDPEYPIFHGRGEHFTAGDAADPAQRLRMATEIVGDVLTPRMAFSASQIGRSVSSWPQLGSTAMMSGAFTAAAARNIICGRRVESGRYQLPIESILFGSSSIDSDGWNELNVDELAVSVNTLTAPSESR